MTIHLIKLSVGPQSLSDLEARQKNYLQKNQKAELVHITRQTPRRAAELLEGGSIYWVIKGWVCARQKLIELRPLVIDDISHCGLVFENELIRVTPRPHRPFQGWRYLEAKDAPPDLSENKYYKDLPDTLLVELAKVGLV